MPEIDIDWVEIPEGEFLMGLSPEQKESVQQRLERDLSVYKQQYATKFHPHPWLTWREYEQAHDFAMIYLRYVPDQCRVYLPTFYIARFPITNAQALTFAKEWSSLDTLLPKMSPNERASVYHNLESQAAQYPYVPSDIAPLLRSAIESSLGVRLPIEAVLLYKIKKERQRFAPLRSMVYCLPYPDFVFGMARQHGRV